MGILNSTTGFFTEGVIYEPCEAVKCNVDQRSFNAYLYRWLGATAELAPFTHTQILELLKTSAAAAAKTCTGGTSGNACGLKWTTGAFDGSVGVGEQMAALEVIQSNLVDEVAEWASDVKGTGTSVGDANAGSSSSADSRVEPTTVTTADRAGAGILTALLLIGVVASCYTMILDH